MSIRRSVLISSLALLAATLFSCGGDSNPAAPSPVHVIVIRGNNGNFSFDPVNEIIHVGQSVAWRNDDFTTHAIVDDSGVLNTGNIAPGATSGSVALSAPATIQYHCSIHPTMKGLLSVNP